MESSMKMTRERVDSVVTAEDDTSCGVSPISPISFDHALQQLEEDLGLQESPSRNYNQNFPTEQRPQGPYGPVANNLFSSRPIWQAQHPIDRPRNGIRHTVAMADIPPLTFSPRPTLNKAASRLSIDGSNIEFVSDLHRQNMRRPNMNARHSTAMIAQNPASPTGNMNGLQRNKRANFHRPAPRKLEQRRNSERSLSSISDASPSTPEQPFRFLEPLRTSPQQLPRLVIPSRRKKSSAADQEPQFEAPPPIPEYSMARPRKSASANRISVAMSPKAHSDEWAALTDDSHNLEPDTPSILKVEVPSLSPIGLPKIQELQSAQDASPFEDSPTIPKSIQSLPESPRQRPSTAASTISTTSTPISATNLKPKPTITPPSKLAHSQDSASIIPEPFILPASPTQDVFFTISDYYTQDSPYDTTDLANSTYYYLQKKDSYPLPPYSAISEDQISLHEQQQQLGLRDYVQRILRRSDSQRQSTSSWTKPRSSHDRIISLASDTSEISSLSSLSVSDTDSQRHSSHSSISSCAPSPALTPPTVYTTTASNVPSEVEEAASDRQCRTCGDLFPHNRWHATPTLLCVHEAELCRPCLSGWVKNKLASQVQIKGVVGSGIKCPSACCGKTMTQEDVVAVRDMWRQPS